MDIFPVAATELEVRGMLDGLFPESVITKVAAPWMWSAELTGEEKIIIGNAVDRRRRQFTAGRTCARCILKGMGLDDAVTIGKDKHGAPVWPEGIVGSISHTDQVCIVSIARKSPELAGLGVDVEHDAGLEPALMHLVCDEQEREACCKDPAGNPYRLAKVVFSAKESVFKCLYPIIGTVLDFHDVHVQLDVAGQKFTGTPKDNLHRSLVNGACSGRLLYRDGHIYTSCMLTRVRHDAARETRSSGDWPAGPVRKPT